MTQLLLAAAFACAVAYLFMPAGRNRVARAIVKTVPVALFAVVAMLAGAPVLLVAALVHSAAGDLLLTFARPAVPEDDASAPDPAFLAGLIAFLAGHVIYVVLFAQTQLSDTRPFALSIGLLMTLAAAAIGAILFRHAGPLRWPVMAYVAAILAMGLAALTTGSWLLVAGAVLFMASDAILGIERFVLPAGDERRSFTGPAIWALYVAAQTLILFAFI